MPVVYRCVMKKRETVVLSDKVTHTSMPWLASKFGKSPQTCDMSLFFGSPLHLLYTCSTYLILSTMKTRRHNKNFSHVGDMFSAADHWISSESAQILSELTKAPTKRRL